MQPKNDSTPEVNQDKDTLYKGANFSAAQPQNNPTPAPSSPQSATNQPTGAKINSLNIDDNQLVNVAGDKPISDFSNLTVSNTSNDKTVVPTPKINQPSGKYHWYLVGGMGILALAIASVLTYATLAVLHGGPQKSSKGLLSQLPSSKQISLNVPLNGNQSSVLFDQTNLKTINLNGDVTATGNVTALSFAGDGANLTNLNASNLKTGTVSNSRLSPQVTLLGNSIPLTNLQGNVVSSINGVANKGGNINIVGDSNIAVTPNQANNSVQLSLSPSGNITNQGNTFNGPNELVQLNNTGALPTLDASNLENLNASNITSGTLSDSRLSPNVTTQGNAFNGDSELVQLTNTGALPSLDASNLTNINASNISLGTLSNSRLSTSVTLQGNAFNNADELVQLNNSGALPALNGALLNNLDAGNISAGTLSDLRLEPDVTLQGNTFNNANQLVQLTSLGYYPAINGSLIQHLNGSAIDSGTISDTVLEPDVVLNDQSNTFTQANTFNQPITVDSIQPSTSLTIGSSSKPLTLQGNSSTTLVSTSNSHTTTIGFSGTPSGNVIYNFDTTAPAGTYTICTTANIGTCTSGGGGNVSTAGGNANKVAVFNGSFGIQSSDITDNLSTNQVSIAPPSGKDNTQGFQIQDSSGDVLLNGDTVHDSVAIGEASTSNPSLYQLEVAGNENVTGTLYVGGTPVCTSSGCTATSGAYIQNGLSTQANANFNIQSIGAGDVGGIIQGFSGQTADLLQLKNSGGGVVANIDASGNINTVGKFEVNGTQISSSNLSDSANLAKLNGNQSFTGNNTFTGTFLDKNSADSGTAFEIQNAAGTDNLFVADTTDNRIGIGTANPGYTLDVNGNINIATGSQYLIGGQAICGVAATCAPSSGSGFYIQNTTGLQTSANFNIQSVSPSSVVGVLSGASGQTANLLNLLDGNGFNVANFSNEGALSLGSHASGQTGNIVFQGSGGAGTLTVQGPTTPNAGNYTLSIPAITGNANICTDNSICAGYASATGGNYIAKNAADTSSASFGGTLYQFSNTNTGTAGVLSLTNSGTGSALSVVQSGNPAAGQALILANNTNGTPLGNLLDLQTGGVSKFSVDVNGNVTAKGSVTFSSLNSSGVVHTNGSGQLSTGPVVLGTDTSGSYVANLGTLTGLSATGNSGAGSTPTLSVNYGSTANTAVQGNVTLTCPAAGTNLSGGGNSVTLGAGGSCNSLSLINNPSFSGPLTVSGSSGTATLNLGSAGPSGNTGNLTFYNSSNNKTLTLQAGTTTANLIFTLPTADGSSGQCLQTNGSAVLSFSTCTVSGGTGLTTSSGQQFYLPVYSNGGATQLSKSEIYDNGSGVSIGSTTLNGLFNVGSSSQFYVDSSGNVTTSGTANFNGNTTVNKSSSTTAFVVEGSSVLLTVDTQGNQVVIGSGAGTFTLNSTGGVTLSGTARHLKKIVLTPEYAGAVLDAQNDSPPTGDIGTMTSGWDETQHESYYQWSTGQTATESYDIVVSFALPSDFSAFATQSANSTYPVTIDVENSDGSHSSVTATLKDITTGSGSADGSCNAVALTVNNATWGTPDHDCGGNALSGTYTSTDANDMFSLRLKLTMAANSGSNYVRVGNIKISYLSAY